MSTRTWIGLTLTCLALTATSRAFSWEDTTEKSTPRGEKVRKALEQPLAALEFENQPLVGVLEHLQEETKIAFILDKSGLLQTGIDADGLVVKYKAQNVTPRTALRAVLQPHGLTFLVVGDDVVITTEELAVARQLRQRVSVDLDRIQVVMAIRQLARETATNLLVDARVTKESQTPVTLRLDDVPLETAVRLVAEMAGLKAARLGNVLLVTNKAHAAELRAEGDLVPSPQAPMNPNLGGNVPPGIPPGAGGPGGPGRVGGQQQLLPPVPANPPPLPTIP